MACEEPHQPLGELDGRDRGVGGGGDVGELARLGGHRVADLLAAVAGVDDPEAGDAVDVLAAVDVVEEAAPAALEDAQAALLGQLDVVGGVDPDVLERAALQVAIGLGVGAGDFVRDRLR